MPQIPITIGEKREIMLPVGKHSELIRSIVLEFIPRFVPGAKVLYVEGAGATAGVYDRDLFIGIGLDCDDQIKYPDVVLYWKKKKWVFLVETVTNHGPIDAKRHEELAELFTNSTAGIVYVTAFPNRSVLARFISEISWETEVWVASDPSHIIHFNGSRFLGPYDTRE